MTKSIFIYIRMLFISALLVSMNVNAQSPTPQLSPDWDWLKLTSDEWLKGELVGIYDENVEFDSDNLGVLQIDWEDVSVLVTKGRQSLRFSDDTIVEGKLSYRNGTISLDDNGSVSTFNPSDLVSAVQASGNEWGYWDGSISLGLDIKDGNTVQVDETMNFHAQRRTSTSRLDINYLESQSESTDSTGVTTVTTDSQRLNAFFDLYISQRWFFRAADYEYFADPFQNIDSRQTFGIAIGYTIVDTADVSWEASIGPSYQETSFDGVQAGYAAEESSKVLAFDTLFDWELIDDLNYFLAYNYKDVSVESGDGLHHLETGFSIEVINDLDVSLTYYLDRTDVPQPLADGSIPLNDDKRFVVSVGYSF